MPPPPGNHPVSVLVQRDFHNIWPRCARRGAVLGQTDHGSVASLPSHLRAWKRHGRPCTISGLSHRGNGMPASPLAGCCWMDASFYSYAGISLVAPKLRNQPQPAGRPQVDNPDIEPGGRAPDPHRWLSAVRSPDTSLLLPPGLCVLALCVCDLGGDTGCPGHPAPCHVMRAHISGS